MTTADVPDVNCLNDDPHEPHYWSSLRRRWACPGRSISKAKRLAGGYDPLIDGATSVVDRDEVQTNLEAGDTFGAQKAVLHGIGGEVDPIEATHLADRIRAADRRSPCSVPEMFMLSRTDVHILALQLDDNAATIARLRAELTEATR